MDGKELHWLRFVQDGRAWEVDVHELWDEDTIALQELARGRTWWQILAGLDKGDMVAIKVMWWAARRANGETTLSFDDCRFKWNTLSFAWTSGPTAPADPAVDGQAAEQEPTRQADTTG